MTPEGKVKSKVQILLASEQFRPFIWQYPVVETGFGSRAVDRLACVKGQFLAIECKADARKKLTPRQEVTKDRIEAAGGRFIEVYDEESLRELDLWLSVIAGGK